MSQCARYCNMGVALPIALLQKDNPARIIAYAARSECGNSQSGQIACQSQPVGAVVHLIEQKAPFIRFKPNIYQH